jgi:hypothetical protein
MYVSKRKQHIEDPRLCTKMAAFVMRFHKRLLEIVQDFYNEDKLGEGPKNMI